MSKCEADGVARAGMRARARMRARVEVRARARSSRRPSRGAGSRGRASVVGARALLRVALGVCARTQRGPRRRRARGGALRPGARWRASRARAQDRTVRGPRPITRARAARSADARNTPPHEVGQKGARAPQGGRGVPNERRRHKVLRNGVSAVVRHVPAAGRAARRAPRDRRSRRSTSSRLGQPAIFTEDVAGVVRHGTLSPIDMMLNARLFRRRGATPCIDARRGAWRSGG